MGKEKFLKQLEEKLSILNDKEKADIIDEYRSTIEEKVKNGQKEIDAVKDFGDIDELVSEILSAYKIDPKYNKETDFQKFVSDGEKLIKDSANKLASASKKVAENFKSNNELNLPLLFEILIKVFIVLIIIGIMKIPFLMLVNLGSDVFDRLFNPFGMLIKALWTVFLVAIYLVAIVLIVSGMFKEYFMVKSRSKEKTESKSLEKKEKKLEKRELSKTDNTLSSFMTIIKVFVIVFVLIPFICSLIGLVIAICFSIYYLFIGIDLIGLVLLLIGLLFINIWFIKLIYNLIQSKKGFAIYLLVLGIILFISGTILFANMVMSIQYVNEPVGGREFQYIDNVYKLDKPVYIDEENVNVIFKTDEMIEDNTFKINVSYDSDLYNVKIEEIKNHVFNDLDCMEDNRCGTYDYYKVYILNNESLKSLKKLYDNFINDLKNKRIHNYSSMFEPEVIISSNSKTMNLIKIDD